MSLLLLIGGISLYPTWFRWKRREITDGFISVKTFISHMVQMKGLSLIKSPLFLTKTLYPTWFRWKLFVLTESVWKVTSLYIPHGSDERSLTLLLRLSVLHLYIPHGSDESQMKLIKSKIWKFSLYPTWFRWKLKNAFAFEKLMFWNFISHMVQMKVAAFNEQPF